MEDRLSAAKAKRMTSHPDLTVFAHLADADAVENVEGAHQPRALIEHAARFGEDLRAVDDARRLAGDAAGWGAAARPEVDDAVPGGV